MEDFCYGIDHLTPEIALQIARNEIRGILADKAKEKVLHCYNAVQKIAQGERPVYSINTGFGSLCTTKISKEDAGTLQENLLKSHSVGMGDPIDAEIAKLMLILKVHALCQGFSGTSLKLIERIIWHIDNNYIPKVPEQGSVGASGDLCPLSHLFIPLIGLGEVTNDNGKTYIPTQTVLTQYNLTHFALGAKEGLALINGTQFMAAHGIKIIERLQNCQDHAEIIAALSLEGYMGSKSPFDKRLHQVRPHPGARISAKRMWALLENSEIQVAHKDCTRVQDPYSFRCIPQIHGASRDALVHLKEIITREINSVTDNPNVFTEGDESIAISGGGFHGEPIALPMDYAGLAASELGNIADRRIYLLMGEKGEYGLPLYLIKGSGLNSGFMITQYCSAALVSENKSLCYPASADSIPTSNGVEDLVSMGSISARKTLRIIDNLEKIQGVELFCACQAIDFRRPLKSSPTLEKCYQYVRSKIPHIADDEVLSGYMNSATEIIRSKKLLTFFNI
ncbi:histidine ammonia-lyase [Candidatus Lokiarchaeum ossiferum]|uniref:histidine ammonia-lyase n=1 Tax=Candidatus Lokiarchaeum ossiferum TaxID=2951803 RepID=UPI00352F1F80